MLEVVRCEPHVHERKQKKRERYQTLIFGHFFGFLFGFFSTNDERSILGKLI